MSTPGNDLLGSVIAGYRLEAVIGAGGMGCVYRGVHTRLGRKAAVKVLADSLARDPEYVSRFFQEAKVVAAIGHKNIIDIVDFFEEDEPRRVAYVMELVHGPSLASVLRARRLTLTQALNIALQIADALGAVHAIKVVHRDLKPENVLVSGSLDSDLSARPSLKLLDFGIAKVQDPTAGHKTSTGMTMGTPAYMAPEQIVAEPVSSATDVYALGEILYEMLAGARLFEGANMVVMRAKLSDTPPVLTIPRDIPGWEVLEPLVLRTVAVHPHDRPGLDEIVATLTEVLAVQPSSGVLAGGPTKGGAHTTTGGSPRTPPRLTPTGARATPTSADPTSGAPASRPAPRSTPRTEVTPAPLDTSAALTVPPSRTNLVAIGGGLVALLGAVAFFFVHTREEPTITEIDVRATEQAPTSKRVEVISTPSGATVIDVASGAALGATPLTIDQATGKTRRLRLTLAGHVLTEPLGADVPRTSVALAAEPTAPAEVKTPDEKPAEPTHGAPNGVAAKKRPAQGPTKGTASPKGESSPLKKGELPEW